MVDAYAVLMSGALYDTLPPPQELGVAALRQFLDEYATLRAAAPELILEEFCTEKDLLAMAALYCSVARPVVRECAARFLERLEPLGEVRELSPTEEGRLLRALYRFQLYCNLFGPGLEGYMFRTACKLWFEYHLDMFFCLFKPWEIEEVWCIYVLFRGVYTNLVDTVAPDLSSQHPRFQNWPHPHPPPCWEMDDPRKVFFLKSS